MLAYAQAHPQKLDLTIKNDKGSTGYQEALYDVRTADVRKLIEKNALPCQTMVNFHAAFNYLYQICVFCLIT